MCVEGVEALRAGARTHFLLFFIPQHRIQFDDTATCTYEYPSEASMLEADTSGGSSSNDGETSASGDAAAAGAAGAGGTGGIGGASAARSTGTLPSLLGEKSHGTLLFQSILISARSAAFFLDVARDLFSSSSSDGDVECSIPTSAIRLLTVPVKRRNASLELGLQALSWEVLSADSFSFQRCLDFLTSHHWINLFFFISPSPPSSQHGSMNEFSDLPLYK
jgi:hypothetical protein